VGKRKGDRDLLSIFVYGDKRYTLFSIWTNKYVEIEFNTLNNRLPEGNEEILKKLLSRLNELEGVKLPDDSIRKLPSIRFEVFMRDNNREKFIEIFNWFIGEIRKFVDNI